MSQHRRAPSVFTMGLWSSVVMVTCAVASVSTRQSTAPPPPSTVLSAEDRATLTRLCIDCHDLGLAADNRRTRHEWNGVLENMRGRGATWTEEDFALALNVLTRTSGLVQVNRADAQEIAAVLKLAAKESDAIIAYRAAHGPFADLDALAKVPGLDPKKLETVADRVLFQQP